MNALCIYTVFSLFSHLSVDPLVDSILGIISSTRMNVQLSLVILTFFPLDIYPVLEWLDHIAILFSVF